MNINIYNKVGARVKWFLPLCLFAFMPLAALSQSLKAEISPIEMMIGEQATVTLSVDAGEGAQVVWPTFSPRQQIVPGVEVLATHVVDSRTMTILLTSFDGNLYPLPSFTVKVGGQEVKSAELALKVIEVEVDTTHLEKMFPPKDVQDNPFLWSEWAPAFWMSVLILLLIALGYWLYLRLRDNKPIIAYVKIVKRLLPHQKAMQEIEQIKADKMVIAENPKEYYTKLTDTLRKYIEERYGFSAMEMTSSEIIERLTAAGDQQSLDELRQLFTTADLVKFAKYSTMINENDANLVNAIDFINQTKLDNQPTEEVVKPQLTEADKRSARERLVLKSVIVLISAGAAALFGFVVYTLYQLLR
ncbi:MAG: hypothetical protein IJ637_01485 [Prevotella sp.]|nr:hypothetical protein [Prevotella sp.]